MSLQPYVVDLRYFKLEPCVEYLLYLYHVYLNTVEYLLFLYYVYLYTVEYLLYLYHVYLYTVEYLCSSTMYTWTL